MIRRVIAFVRDLFSVGPDLWADAPYSNLDTLDGLPRS